MGLIQDPLGALQAQQRQQQAKPIPFNDFAKTLDPSMPQAQYDDLRWQYFATHVKENFSPLQQSAAWADFKQRTERPKLIASPTMAKFKLGALSAAQRATDLAAKGNFADPKQAQALQKKKEDLIASMHHDGLSTGIAEGVGQAIPDLALFTGIETVTAGAGTGLAADIEGVPLLGDAAKILTQSALAARMARGGLVYGTFEAATAENGESPGYSFIKGFGVGASWEVGLLGLSKVLGKASSLSKDLLNKKAADLAKDLATPEETAQDLQKKMAKPGMHDADKVGAEHLQSDLRGAKEQGLPLRVGIDNSRLNGRVIGLKGDKTPFSFDIEAYKEDSVAEQLKDIVNNGGEIHAVFGNENNMPQTIRMLSAIRNLRNDRVYKLSLLNSVLDKYGHLIDDETFTQGQREQFLNRLDQQLEKFDRDKEERLQRAQTQASQAQTAQEPLATEAPASKVRKPRTVSSAPPTLTGDGLTQPGGQQFSSFTMRSTVLGSKGVFADVLETSKPREGIPHSPTQAKRLYITANGDVQSFANALGTPIKKGSPGNEWVPKNDVERRESWTLFQNYLKAAAGPEDNATITASQELKNYVQKSIAEPPPPFVPDNVQFSKDPKTPGLVIPKPDFVDTVPTKTQVALLLLQHETPEGLKLSSGERVSMLKRIMSLWDKNTPKDAKLENALALRDTGLDYLVPKSWQYTVRSPKSAIETAEETAAQEFEQAPQSSATEETEKARYAQIKQTLLDRGLKPEDTEAWGTAVAEEERKLSEVPKLSAERSNLVIPTTDALRSLKEGVKTRRNIIDVVAGRKTIMEIFNGDADIRAMAYTLNKARGTAQELAEGSRTGVEEFARLYPEYSASGIRVLPNDIKFRLDAESSLYHEDLHIQLNLLRYLEDPSSGTDVFSLMQFYHHTPDLLQKADPVIQRAVATIRAIGNGLIRESPGYRQQGPLGVLEEAFVHPATAIRVGDLPRIAKFGYWDTDPQHVREAVDWVAKNLKGVIGNLPDTQELRSFNTRLEDLMRRTGVDRFQRWHDEAMKQEFYFHFDPELKQWIFIDAMGRGIRIMDRGEVGSLVAVADQLETLAGFEEQVPSATQQFERMGLRGAMAERASVVNGTMDKPTAYFMPKSDENFKGLRAVAALWEPMLGWAARTETAFKARGVDLGLFDLVKDVDDAGRAGIQWHDDMLTSAAKFIPADANKAIAMLPFMQAEDSALPSMQRSLGMDDAFMQNVQGLRQWMKDFQAQTGIQVQTYLRKDLGRLQNMKYSPTVVWPRGLDRSELSRIARAIVDKEINPQDPHIGHFTSWLIKEGFEAKFTGEPLRKLSQLVAKTDAEGRSILGVDRANVDNYIRYMKGIPDVTQQIMLKAVGDFQMNLGKAFAGVNKQLGTKLPETFNYPGDLLQKYMLLSYLGGIGMRPAIWARDAMQGVTNTLPVIGPVKFMRGVAELFRPGAWQEAMDAGALLGRHNVQGLFGDVFQEQGPQSGGILDKAVTMAGKLLAPSRWGHNIARFIAYHGELKSALESVADFRANRIDAHELLENTSMWFFDAPLQKRLLKQILDKTSTKVFTISTEDMAKKIALESVDHTLWAYRRGTQPLFLRTGIGRIFGQYGLWPMSYLDFLRRLTGKLAEHPRKSVQALGLWYAANKLASSTFSAVGGDVSKWFFISPAGYGGSPHLQMAQALGQSLENSEQGRAARKTVLEYPLNFIPAFLELKSVSKYIADGSNFFNDDWSLTDDAVRIMGMHPQSPPLDLTPEEEIEYQTGFNDRR